MDVLDSLLKRYRGEEPGVQLRVRLFSVISLVVLILLPVLIIETVVIQLLNPVNDRRVNFGVILPQIAAFVLFLGILYPLWRGRFAASANAVLLVLFSTAWTVMFLDRSSTLSRLDTIAFIFAILILAPLAASGRGLSILAYGAANLAALLAFVQVSRIRLGIPDSAVHDYVLDNAVAIVFCTIAAYLNFSVNRSALGQAARELREHRSSSRALERSETKYRSLVETTGTGYVILDAQGRVKDANPEYVRLTGRGELGRILGRSVLEWTSEADRERNLAEVEKCLATGSARNLEVDYVDEEGRFTPIEINATVVRDGDEIEIVTLCRDISERRREKRRLQLSLAEKETLLRELYHRTKNNMGVIIGLLSLQEKSIGDDRISDAFTETQNRIHAMALVHEKLYEAQNLSHLSLRDYIEDLVELLVNSYQISPSKARVRYEMEEVSITIDSAIPCGLILNELITNALKYAFPGDRKGEISIRLARSGDEIALDVRDDGVGLPSGFDEAKDGGMGMRIVRNLAEDQLGGVAEVRSAGGLAYRIRFVEKGTERV
jgi:PAS domain S-box-containing protein